MRRRMHLVVLCMLQPVPQMRIGMRWGRDLTLLGCITSNLQLFDDIGHL